MLSWVQSGFCPILCPNPSTFLVGEQTNRSFGVDMSRKPLPLPLIQQLSSGPPFFYNKKGRHWSSISGPSIYHSAQRVIMAFSFFSRQMSNFLLQKSLLYQGQRLFLFSNIDILLTNAVVVLASSSSSNQVF